MGTPFKGWATKPIITFFWCYQSSMYEQYDERLAVKHGSGNVAPVCRNASFHCNHCNSETNLCIIVSSPDHAVALAAVILTFCDPLMESTTTTTTAPCWYLFLVCFSFRSPTAPQRPAVPRRYEQLGPRFFSLALSTTFQPLLLAAYFQPLL